MSEYDINDNDNNEEFNEVDYSHVFGSEKADNTPEDEPAKDKPGGYMAGRSKRGSGKAGDSIDDYDSDDSLELSAGEIPTFKNSVGGILIFTVLWCGFIAAFIGIVGYQVHRSLNAQKYFKTTQGVVLSSEVASHSSDDGTTYSPKIKYVYTVNGKEYINKDYELGDSSSSGSWAHEIVRENPIGKKVEVYYDPDDPQEAALYLGIPEFAEVALLFLQPFILVGLGMICYTIKSAANYRREKHDALIAQRDPMSMEITLWHEKPVQTAQGFQLISRPKKSIMMALIGGYGLTIFFSLFYFAIAKDFEQPLNESITAMKVALGVGILFAFITIILQAKSQGSVFTVDTSSGYISLDAKNTTWELQFSSIDQWYIRKLGTNTKINDRPVMAYLLAVKDNNGREYPLHAFYSNTGNAIAKRAAIRALRLLAQTTNKPTADKMVTRLAAEKHFDSWKLSKFKDLK